MNDLDTPLNEVAKGIQSLDDLLTKSPTSITKEELMAVVLREREARAAWKKKQEKKGKEE